MSYKLSCKLNSVFYKYKTWKVACFKFYSKMFFLKKSLSSFFICSYNYSCKWEFIVAFTTCFTPLPLHLIPFFSPTTPFHWFFAPERRAQPHTAPPWLRASWRSIKGLFLFRTPVKYFTFPYDAIYAFFSPFHVEWVPFSFFFHVSFVIILGKFYQF